MHKYTKQKTTNKRSGQNCTKHQWNALHQNTLMQGNSEKPTAGEFGHKNSLLRAVLKRTKGTMS